MLTLPIKKKWYDMILSGEKKEEYREIKPYYEKRFTHVGLLDICEDSHKPTKNTAYIVLRNGYSSDAPQFVAEVKMRIDYGRPEWGAVPGVLYYVLEIQAIHHRKGG